MSTLMLTLGMTGCGNDSTTQTTATPSTPPPTNLPVLQVVTDGESPPMTFLDERREPQGIDIDVIRAIGKSQGFQVEIHIDLFDNLLSGIESGKYDLAISSLSLTQERASKYGHSKTYLHNPGIIMHSRKNLNSIDGLKDLRVATTKGTIYTPIIQELQPAKHRMTQTNFQSYQELLRGNVDALMGDKYIFEYLLARHPDQRLSSFHHKIGDDSSANMVIYTKKDNQELIDKLNKGIDELKKSGKIDTIVQNYMGPAK